MSYLKNTLPGNTPQSEPLAGSTQVPNSAGGFTWELDAFGRLRRFLILGTEGGTYYASERDATQKGVSSIHEALALDPERTITMIAEISDGGLAPKNDPAIYALAVAASHKDADVRKMALENLSKVCRIGTHLFTFCEFIDAMRGWGPQLRRYVGQWYTSREPKDLGYQLIKYRQRGGWSHRDVLRLAHPLAEGEMNDLLHWAVQPEDVAERTLPAIVSGYIAAQAAPDAAETVRTISTYREGEGINLPWEALNTDHLKDSGVWSALLDGGLPMTALVRNLNRLTMLGLLEPGTEEFGKVLNQITDEPSIKKSRLHPVKILAALLTYKAGRGVRGSMTWRAVPQIIDALDDAFYLAFQNVSPSNKRILLGFDVSSSMEGGTVAGVPGLTPRVASAAMGLVTAATEPAYQAIGFTSNSRYGSTYASRQNYKGFQELGDGLHELPLSKKQRLDDVVSMMNGLPFGSTDCSLPMQFADKHSKEFDAFVIYTDSETWFGGIHPSEALRNYRRNSGINDARLVVVGMVANNFTIADPNDPGMLDVVGFDTSAPALMADFMRGDL